MSGDRSLPERVAAATAPIRGDGRGWVLLSVAAGWFLTLGLRFAIPALLPAIKDTFAIGNAAAGFAVTVVWGTYAGMQLPAGVLSDRIAVRTVLAASLGLAGASLLLFGLVPAFPLFVAAAGLFGLGTGLYGPARGLALSETFRRGEGVAFGATLAAGSLGAAIVPVVAIELAVVSGWQLALAAFAPLFGLLAGAVWWAAPGPASAVATDGGSDDAETEGGEGSRDDSDAGGTRSAVWRAVTHRHVLLAAVGGTLMLFAFQGLTAFYTTYLIEQKSLTTGTAGALFAALFLGGAVFQSTAGRLTDLYGHRRVLVGVSVCSLPPLALLPVADHWAAIAALSVLLSVRLAVGPVVNAYVIGALPERVRGSAWGLLRTVVFLVGSLGSVVVGVVADAGQFDAAVWGLAGLSVPAALAFAALPDRNAAD